MEFNEAMAAYENAVVEHTRAFDMWANTSPGSGRAAALEEAMRQTFNRKEAAARQLIEFFPVAQTERI